MGANVDGYITIGTKIDLSGLKSDMSQLQSVVKDGTNKMINTVEKNTQKMTTTIANSFRSLKRIILGLGIVALIRNMFDMGDAVDRVDVLNNYAKVMGNLGISAQEAQKSVNILSDKLVGLPTTLDSAALAVQRFTSSNNDIATSTKMFLALNNAILAGGANTQIQKSALEQMSQAYAKGRPDMMEWRVAMMAMPAQLKQVATAMGYVNAQQLGEAIRSGKVSMDAFMTTIMRLNKEGLPGLKSFEEQARNATGGIRTSIINLKTAVTRGLADIMNAIGQSNIAAFFNNIAKAISRVIPYISAFVKALMMLFGVKTKKQADNTSTSLDNLGGSGKNVSKGLDSATGSAKSLNKELKGLASFDEMNVLPDKSQSAGGGAGGIGAAADIGEIDLTGFETSLENVTDKVDKLAKKIYKILKPIFNFIKDNWREIVAGIAAVKIAKLISSLKNLKLVLQNIKGVGIALAIAGIVHTVRKIIDFIHDPSWDNFLGILEGIALAVIGIALAFGAWPVAVVAALALIVIEVIKHVDVIKNAFIKFLTWIKDGFLMTIKNLFTVVKDFILMPFQVAIEIIMSYFNNLKNAIKKIIDGIKLIFKGDFKEGITKILGGFGDILLAPFRALKDGAKKLIDKVIGFVKDLIGWVKDAIDWIKDLFTSSDEMSKKIKGNASAGGGKGGGGGGGHGGFAKGGIIYSRLPRLASGGIINQPGRGVPLGSAIGGERGMEGVIPLTDSQQMAILGEAIGKYITINANITNEMNGRVISRELQKINNESDFAFNR